MDSSTSSEHGNEEEEQEDYGAADDNDDLSVTNTVSSFSLTGEKMPSKGGTRNGQITIKGVDPTSPFHRALLLNPDAWTDGKDMYASACFLLPSCYKSQGDMESSRFCATILPNRKEVQIDLRLPFEFTCGDSSAFFFGLPHHDAASAAFLAEITKRQNNNPLQSCKERLIFSLPFEVEPDFCDNPPTGNGCVFIREADGGDLASRHFLFTVKKRSTRYIPRVQTNDFSFNPYGNRACNGPSPGYAPPHPSTPGSAPRPTAAPMEGFASASSGGDNMMEEGMVPMSPGGLCTTPQKRQKNN